MLFDCHNLRIYEPVLFSSIRRTSKNQRKAQRKKWSLKEGSKHEDLALLDEIKKLITRIDSMRGTLSYLISDQNIRLE